MALEMKSVKVPHDIRRDFPALAQSVHGKPVCYLDSAASAQKPQVVIDAMAQVMETHYANVHRGVYAFGAATSAAYESARVKVSKFINASTDKNIVFTKNATEAINLVAAGLSESLAPGDEIVISALEHHANIVPWHFLREKKGAIIRVVPIDAKGALDMDALEKTITPKTKIVALTQMSNVLGTIVDVKKTCALAKNLGAVTLIDGCQAAVHLPVDVQDIGCDFYVFTGHKLYGPTGIGVLYGQTATLAALPPYQGGGEMVDEVSADRITYKDPPYRFEAGTPPIIEAIGLGVAIDYLSALDAHARYDHAHALAQAAEDGLTKIKGVTVLSKAPNRADIVSFMLAGVHPHDIATVLDQMGIAVRAGNHCAQPLMKVLNVPATVRASFGIYNTLEDVTRLVAGVKKAQELFA